MATVTTTTTTTGAGGEGQRSPRQDEEIMRALNDTRNDKHTPIGVVDTPWPTKLGLRSEMLLPFRPLLLAPNNDGGGPWWLYDLPMHHKGYPPFWAFSRGKVEGNARLEVADGDTVRVGSVQTGQGRSLLVVACKSVVCGTLEGVIVLV